MSKNSIPQGKKILTYEDFFNEPPPVNRLDLIRNIPKKPLLYELAGLNFRLFKPLQISFDLSSERQAEELKRFSPMSAGLHYQYMKTVVRHSTPDNQPLVFNRPANLFAFEEILNCEEWTQEDDNFTMANRETWDSIFRYLLAVNSHIVTAKVDSHGIVSLDSINAGTILLNELVINDNPLLAIYRGIKLMDFMSSDATYGSEFQDYFTNVVKNEPQRFAYEILSLFVANRDPNPNFRFHYQTKDPNIYLEFLSQHPLKNTNPNILVTIKKTPFYKAGDNKYIVLDLGFMLNKVYDFLVYDFWFDHLKKKGNTYNMPHYKSAIGYFFEDYVRNIFQASFGHLKHPKPLLFDELRVNGIEVADIYIRQNRKVLIGQVKSTPIYDEEKYSGDFEKLYKNDRNIFFSNFGVNQVVDSIKYVIEYHHIFDNKFSLSGTTFYPVIIMNDKIFKTPFFASVFERRFNELIHEEEFQNFLSNKNASNVIIRPLILSHITDWEYLENGLSTKKIEIWDIFKKHYENKKFVPPFYHTAEKQREFYFIDKVNKMFLGMYDKYGTEIEE